MTMTNTIDTTTNGTDTKIWDDGTVVNLGNPYDWTPVFDFAQEIILTIGKKKITITGKDLKINVEDA